MRNKESTIKYLEDKLDNITNSLRGCNLTFEEYKGIMNAIERFYSNSVCPALMGSTEEKRKVINWIDTKDTKLYKILNAREGLDSE